MKKNNYSNPKTEVVSFMGQNGLCQQPLTPPGGGPMILGLSQA